MLDNVRLWDWRAFHDTLSQSQPLRPYAYADTDVDRYTIDGQMRQVLLAPRELDLTPVGRRPEPLGDLSHHLHARLWPGAGRSQPHHAQRASRAADPQCSRGSADAQPEADPSRDLLRRSSPAIPCSSGPRSPSSTILRAPRKCTRATKGKGGIPADSMGLRLASAWAFGDPNIVLSDAFTSESRMMIRRGIRERLGTLAPFITWDPDAYMVIGDDGRLVWMVDGYTTSEAHPYARPIQAEGAGEFNYIRNSVKATVDAYDGDGQAVSVGRSGPVDPGVRASVPRTPDARFGDARGCAAPYAFPGAAVPRAGRAVPHLSHARAGFVLQPGRPLGFGYIHQRPSREPRNP